MNGAGAEGGRSDIFNISLPKKGVYIENNLRIIVVEAAKGNLQKRSEMKKKLLWIIAENMLCVATRPPSFLPPRNYYKSKKGIQ